MKLKKSFHRTLVSLTLCSAMVLSMSAPMAYANQVPRALATDSRLRVVPYDANNVVTMVGTPLMMTSLEFGPMEVVDGVEFGDSVSWKHVVNKVHPNILFIKPVLRQSSDTNLTVITNKYTYHFRLLANKKTDKPEKASPIYNIRFVYPEEEAEKSLADAMKQERRENALVADHNTDPFSWNWNYAYSACCSKDNVPIKAFDDGEFTYFQFSPHAELPSIFVVDGQGHESLAATTMKGPYVVVQLTARQFTFRNGKDSVSCIFNENYQA